MDREYETGREVGHLRQASQRHPLTHNQATDARIYVGDKAPTSNVQAAIGLLFESLDIHSRLQQQFMARLHDAGVIQQEPPRAVLDDPNVPPPAFHSSDLARRIVEARSRIEAMTAEFSNVLDRLDI